MRHSLLPLFLLTLCAGCAYPHRVTHIQPAPAHTVPIAERPDGMWSMRVIRGYTPPRGRTGLEWDSDKTGPDPFVRLLVDGRLIWESEAIENNNKPEWNAALPGNIYVAQDARFRLELWDRDSMVDADPLGHIERQGLPATARPDAEARLSFDSGAWVEIMVTAPRPHKGVGLRYEVRSEFLRVLEVEPHSPAARAGLAPGDDIVQIGNERVVHMGGNDASSALSMAAERSHKLVVKTGDRAERTVELDKGPIWLVM